ncbi:MAG: hypothetical protein KIT34_09795 [Cyanobacteria bacterium TGS_CYA1]|nr:hypothetical protein [Cyanobacteria bacterium TGS_CYA1]
MVGTKNLFLIILVFALSSQTAIAQVNTYALIEAQHLNLVMNAAQNAAIIQTEKECRSRIIPKKFLIAVRRLKRIQDLKKLVFVLETMTCELSEAGLEEIYNPIEKCFFHTIDIIASKQTPQAQDALDDIRRNCRSVGDAGGSLVFKQICRNHKMKILEMPKRFTTPQNEKYE